MSSRNVEPTLDSFHGGLCHITSMDNAIIKMLKSLSSKKGRDKNGLFMIEGLRLCREAFLYGLELDIIAVSESWFYGSGEGTDFANNIAAGSIKSKKIICLKDRIFNMIADTESPQGIMAVVKIPGREIIRQGFGDIFKGIYLILENIQDPGNLGTIIRTADAAGVSGISLIKGCSDMYNPKVVRSTMGSIFRVPVVLFDNPKEATDFFKGKGIRIVASSPVKGTVYTNADFKTGIAICIGNEANGISDELAVESDEFVKIPMSGAAESLNAAVAAGILMFEAARQRNFVV